MMRSMLFSPANNLRRTYRCGRLGADAVILDLEDAVPMGDKETARLFARDLLPELARQPSAVYVRVNAWATGLTGADLDWVVRPGLDGIMLPKAECAEDVLRAAGGIEERERAAGLPLGGVRLLPLLETARGVVSAREILGAHPRVEAAAFGGVDFARDMGIELTSGGEELAYARAHIALMARAEGKGAIDTPWIDIHDREGLIRHAEAARALGFRGKALIHPGQVRIVNEIFSPRPEALERARRIVEAFREAQAAGAGAISLDGKMIDEANYRQAAELLASAEAPART